MSKDKSHKMPEAPPAAERPAMLCMGIGVKDGKYVIDEVHLGADGKVLARKPIRDHSVRKVAAGYACLDMEDAVTRWQIEGLLP